MINVENMHINNKTTKNVLIVEPLKAKHML